MGILSRVIWLAGLAATATAANIFPDTPQWNYTGCYGETTTMNNTNGFHTLAGGISFAADNMTVPACQAYCESKFQNYAGLEYTRECYCSNYIYNVAPKLADDECNLPCMGNASQICGGALKVSIYGPFKASNKNAASSFQPHMGVVLALGLVGCLVLS